MREVWFAAAIITTMGHLVTEDPAIRWVSMGVSILFWVAFTLTEHYGRLNRAKHQAEKDA